MTTRTESTTRKDRRNKSLQLTGHRAIKDLRDTFASQLITCGVSLGYVSRQLGHRTMSITTESYARWTAGDDYRDPLPLGPEELPADLLSRLSGAGLIALAADPRRRHL